MIVAVLSAPAKPQFQKTEVPYCYRYTSNGIYYALLKHLGKQKRASLQRTDKTVAKRKLGDLQRDLGKVDASQGRMTLRESSNCSLSTIQNQATTVSLKKGVVERLLVDLPVVVSDGMTTVDASARPGEGKNLLSGNASRPALHAPRQRTPRQKRPEHVRPPAIPLPG